MSQSVGLQQILALPVLERWNPLLELAEGLSASDVADVVVVEQSRQALLALLASGDGTPQQRQRLGVVLGLLGDPRLRVPADADYWSTVDLGDYTLTVGKYLVTTAEWRAFLASGSYDDVSLWSAEGLAWRDSGRPSWTTLADAPTSKHLVYPNHPVVGVSWFEAEAYAAAHGARLLERDERLRVSRGPKKRPYPWGAPFGQGNANTSEEVLGCPTAVGLYQRDCTEDGVFDLAGNVGEWTADAVGDRRVIHPGSWEQPSMAAWAKAVNLVSPAARAADLGFRLARGSE